METIILMILMILMIFVCLRKRKKARIKCEIIGHQRHNLYMRLNSYMCLIFYMLYMRLIPSLQYNTSLKVIFAGKNHLVAKFSLRSDLFIEHSFHFCLIFLCRILRVRSFYAIFLVQSSCALVFT